MASESAWRPVFAALANEQTRTVWAQLVLGAPDAGADLSPSRRRHALASLEKAGLIERAGSGWLVVDAFSAVLTAAPRAMRPNGVERFLTASGRIDRYPANLGEREALLRHVVERSIAPGEVLDEKVLGERLARFSDDVAVLRRYLVDFALLERTASGSEYARPASAE